ncbi:MAG: hypothetical protein ACT4NV_14800 [Rhodoferax sp.]
MKRDDLMQELDRNMDTVFDNLYVLNAAMTAMVKALAPATAAQFVQELDQTLDGFFEGRNPPGFVAHQTLLGWRNMAAAAARIEKRGPEA